MGIVPSPYPRPNPRNNGKNICGVAGVEAVPVTGVGAVPVEMQVTQDGVMVWLPQNHGGPWAEATWTNAANTNVADSSRRFIPHLPGEMFSRIIVCNVHKQVHWRRLLGI